MDNQVKIAKINARRDLDLAQLRLFEELLKNPIIELVGAFVLIETLQRHPSSNPIIGNVQGTLMEAGVAGIISMQQIAPVLPHITQATAGLLKAAPLLLA